MLARFSRIAFSASSVLVRIVSASSCACVTICSLSSSRNCEALVWIRCIDVAAFWCLMICVSVSDSFLASAIRRISMNVSYRRCISVWNELIDDAYWVMLLIGTAIGYEGRLRQNANVSLSIAMVSSIENSYFT